jgi:hypothetical protein
MQMDGLQSGGWESVDESNNQPSKTISFKQFISVELAELSVRDVGDGGE